MTDRTLILRRANSTERAMYALIPLIVTTVFIEAFFVLHKVMPGLSIHSTLHPRDGVVISGLSIHRWILACSMLYLG